MSFIKCLIFLGNTLLIINTVIYVKALNKNRAFKNFVTFLILTSIIQSCMIFIAFVLHQNNLFMNNIFLFIQFIFLSLFYKELLANKVIVYVLAFGLVLLGIQYINNISLFKIYNPIGITVTQTLIIVYSIIYFYKSLHVEKPNFIIVNIGVFIYLICSTLIFASGNLVFNLQISFDLYDILFKLNASFYIIFQILIFIEWRKNYYKKIHKLL